MPIFRLAEKNLLFVHVPKAGGTSIERWLSAHATESFHVGNKALPDFPCVPQHFHGAILDALFAPGFFDYSFCVVRNPYARLLSEYNYRRVEARRRERLLLAGGFAPWLRLTFRRYRASPYVLSNHIRPQVEFPTAGCEVFRLEDQLGALEARLGEVTGIGFDGPPAKSNVSKKSGARMTEVAAELIRGFYAADFERFGYDPASWKAFQ